MGTAEVSTDSEPKGIGGWLVIPIIGLAIILALGLFQLAHIALRWESFAELLIKPEYDVGMRLTFLWGISIYSVIPLVPAVLLLRKSRFFPWAYIAWMFLFAGTVLFVAARTGFFTSIIPVVWAIIWTPYLLMSRRIKNTFVN
jgi:hypothetical protein